MYKRVDDNAAAMIEEALDVIACGYPYDATEVEQTLWMNGLRRLFLQREPAIRKAMEQITQEK